MKNKYRGLSIFVCASMCILVLSHTFAGDIKKAVKDEDVPSKAHDVGKIESSFSQHLFPWCVIAPGGGSTSSGSHTMRLTSVGQVFTHTAQGGNYKISSGYISTAAYPYTDVKEVMGDGQLPSSFELFQNYPNPFNPTTNIRFNLPGSGHVRLDIYNILGRRITTLVDEVLTAGHKLVTWDGRDNQGDDVASGIYFYRIEVRSNYGKEKYTKAQKMLLLK